MSSIFSLCYASFFDSELVSNNRLGALPALLRTYLAQLVQGFYRAIFQLILGEKHGFEKRQTFNPCFFMIAISSCQLIHGRPRHKVANAFRYAVRTKGSQLVQGSRSTDPISVPLQWAHWALQFFDRSSCARSTASYSHFASKRGSLIKLRDRF